MDQEFAISDIEEIKNVSDLIVSKDVDVADFSDPCENHSDDGVSSMNEANCFPSHTPRTPFF